ncbi:hypothetical protein PTKIN_Ptkin09bG0215200 [Pterospermum kingtungense]
MGGRLVEFLLVATLLVSVSEELNSEGQYLLELKNGLQDELNFLSNWNSADQTPCGWTGVKCTYQPQPLVWSLDLHSMNLSGMLSPSIGGLLHLKHLDLSYNQFRGDIPKEIGNCSLLTFLYLNENGLSSPIPEEIGNLTSLEEFEAYNNNLSGSLPRSMGNLQILRKFRVGGNVVSGNILQKCVHVRACNCLVLLKTKLEGKFLKK